MLVTNKSVPIYQMNRRQFIQHLGMTAAASALAGCHSLSAISKAPYKASPLYIDGLSFVPNNHADVAASEIDAFIADISAIEEVKQADGSINYKRTYRACIDSIKVKSAEMLKHPDIYHIALKGDDIALAQAQNKCAVFLQIQGADCVEGGLHQVDEFYDLGLRVLQLTHHYNNLYAGGALSSGELGLTDQGKALIEKLESKHMLIDLSHSSVQAAKDTLAIAKGPIVQSHGAARAIINNARCTPDEVIKGIADSGGVFAVFMMSWWLTYEQVPRPEHYIHHLRHIKNVAGAEAVAIANDYPLRGHENALAAGNNNQVAIQGYDSWWQGLGKKGILGFEKEVSHIVIPELNHIKRMRTIDYLLKKAGFSAYERDLIMGKNWQRVLSEVIR